MQIVQFWRHKRSTGETVRRMVFVVACIVILVIGVPQQAHAAATGGLVGLFEKMVTQVEVVWAIAMETMNSILESDVYVAQIAQTDSVNPTISIMELDGTMPMASYKTTYVPVPTATEGTLAINAPLEVTTSLTVSGYAALATTTVSGPFVAETIEATSLFVSSGITTSQLRVSGAATVGGMLTARGGLVTEGADIDLGSGELRASNVLYGLVAGNNIRISGDAQRPRISVDMSRLEMVTSINGEDGELDLEGDGDIDVDGLTISNESTIATVRARGGCSECLLDTDISNMLTIEGGTIENTTIGALTPAGATFTNLAIGSSTQPSTLVVYATTTFEGAFVVTSATTSQFVGGLNVTGGCVSVDGSCLGGASILTDLNDVVATSSLSGDLLQFDGTVWRNVSPASLGIGAIAYTDLSDTPASYVAGAVTYVNSTGDGMSQSSDFVYTGGNLALGTSSPVTRLTVDGDISIVGNNALRLYTSTGGYVGFQASSTVNSDTIWSLPAADGLSYQVLYTDGNGNLEFADVSALGGGANRYTQLLDTPSSLTTYTIPFVNASGTALTQSANLVYTGSNLGVGVASPAERLAVDGSVRFAGPSGQAGLYYFQGGASLGLGTDSPSDRLTILGGSVSQRGGVAGSKYSPLPVGGVSLADTVTDIQVVGQYAYVVSASSGNDFHVIDIKNVATPVEVASINLVTNARAVAVRGQYAFVGTTLTGNDFHVIDISNPFAPIEKTGIDLASSVNDIVVAGRYAYVVTDATGDDFHIIDISNPLEPTEVSSLDLPDGANGVAVVGTYAYVVTSIIGDDFHIIDISNPLQPVFKGSLNLPDTANKVVVEGGYAYVTTDSAGDDVHVIDVRNPNVPALVGGVDLVTSARGLSLSGKYLYVTSLGTSYDFHVIDVENPAAPVLVGEFDPAAGDGLAVQVVGRYAYMTSTSGGYDVHVIDVSGATFQAATIYSINGGTLNVTADAGVGGRVYAGLGVVAGVEGIQTDGVMSILGTGASYIAGSLGIGTTSTTSALTVSGSITSTSLFGGATNLTTDANGVIIRDPSDVRLKEHIETIEDALDMVLQLRGVRYEWKDKERFGTQIEIGFIAQEVDTILPEVVRKGGEYWSLNTRNIVAVVVEAIKELWIKVEGNGEKIENLEKRVAELEAELGDHNTHTETEEGITEVIGGGDENVTTPEMIDDVEEDIETVPANSEEVEEDTPLSAPAEENGVVDFSLSEGDGVDSESMVEGITDSVILIEENTITEGDAALSTPVLAE